MNTILLVSSTLLLATVASGAPPQSSNDNNAADSLSTYFDIGLGRGLYANFKDVVSLNTTTLEQALTSGTSWMMEFYNSWCGHCINFAPTWKRLGLEMKGWSKFVRVGAVDCSHPANTALCRRYEVMSYPTVRYFDPQAAPMRSDFVGVEVDDRKLDALIGYAVTSLSSRHDDSTLRHLLSVRNHSKVDWSTVPRRVDRVVKVVNAPSVGQQLALDLSEIDRIEVITVVEPSSPIDVSIENRPGLEQLDRLELVHPHQTFNRSTLLQSLCEKLCSKGYKIPHPADLSVVKHQKIDVAAAVAVKQFADEIKTRLKNKNAVDVVFQVDIEGGLKHSLNVEIPVLKIISGESMTALKNYIKVLAKYFHFGDNGKRMLQCIDSHLNIDSISGEDFANLTKKCENKNKPVYQTTNLGWVGCRGSSPGYRGFPCSMWTTFHSLTVQQYLKKTGSPLEVLNGISGYVKHFFGCSYCSQHFQKMAQTIDGNVTDGASGLLWLWAAHNEVNGRLSGDATEDPSYPKVQYPNAERCPTCRLPNGTWNRDKVVEYLARVYDSFTYMTMEDIEPEMIPTAEDKTIQSKALRHEYLVDDAQFSERVVNESPSVFFTLGFGLFDFSLCLVLYVFSMGIIALVCVKIIKNKKTSFKKKGHLLDAFLKV